MDAKTVEPDELLIGAGECFMFLLWSETVMRDLVVLKEGSEKVRRQYSEAFGKGPHPSDFAKRRLELGRLEFSSIKDRFLCHWPEWKDNREVRDALERVVVWRNGLGHANVQPFRGHLLYTPTEASWKRIRSFMRCGDCYRYLKDCSCPHENLAEPHSVVIRRETLLTIYLDLRTLDERCFYPSARSLDVEYRGVAWPTEDGAYTQIEHHSVGS